MDWRTVSCCGNLMIRFLYVLNICTSVSPLPPCTLGQDDCSSSVLQRAFWTVHSRPLCLRRWGCCRCFKKTPRSIITKTVSIYCDQHSKITKAWVIEICPILTWHWCCVWCDSKPWPSVCVAWPRILCDPWSSAAGVYWRGFAGIYLLPRDRSFPSPQTDRTSFQKWSWSASCPTLRWLSWTLTSDCLYCLRRTQKHVQLIFTPWMLSQTVKCSTYLSTI